MKPKQNAKITIDALMTALLAVLMAYPITGQMIHEWTGAGMFLLFIAHHILNRHWFKALGKGKYSALRAIQTAADVLLLADMLASYWGLVLMGLHLGLHGGMLAARFRRGLGGKREPAVPVRRGGGGPVWSLRRVEAPDLALFVAGQRVSPV